MPRPAALNRLTDTKIRSYLKDQGATAPLHDGGGLYLRKRASGAFWVQRLTCPTTGNDQWHQVFPGEANPCYPAKTLAEARLKATELKSERATGIDPREARKTRAHRQAQAELEEEQAREEEALRSAADTARRLNVRQLFDRWRATDLQPRLLADGTREGRKDGGAYVSSQFERHVFPLLGEVEVCNLTRQHLMTVLDAQKAAGKLRTTNILFSDLKQMLAFAVDRHIIQSNPLEGLKRRRIGGKDTERNRVLSDAELQLLGPAMDTSGLQQRSQRAIWLALATGTRAGELAGASWADSNQSADASVDLRQTAEVVGTKFGVVDMGTKTWHLPDTKNQRPHTIHLSEFALQQIQALATLRELGANGKPSPWLFPDRNRAQPVCVKSLGKQLADRQRVAEKRLTRRSKKTEALVMPGGTWTLHDLRRTAATVMARLGIGTDVIDECLNHKLESKVARVYIRDRREADQRKAFDALGAYLQALTQGDRNSSSLSSLSSNLAA